VTSRESRLPDNLLVFGRLLRRAAIPVHTGRVLDLVDAFAYLDLAARDEVYHACRTLLVQRHDQMSVFDAAFESFWREHRRGQAASRLAPRPVGASASIVEIEDVLAPEDLIAVLEADDGYWFVGQSGTSYEAHEPLGKFLRSSAPLEPLARVSAARHSIIGIPADHRFFLSFTLAGLGNFSPFNGAMSGVPR